MHAATILICGDLTQGITGSLAERSHKNGVKELLIALAGALGLCLASAG